MRWQCSLWICAVAGGLCVVNLCGCAKQAALDNDTHMVTIKVGKWSEELKSSDSKTRINALNHLGNSNVAAPEAFALVAGALKDPDPAVRREAIRNLWKFEKQPENAIAALTQFKDNETDPKIKGDAETMIKAIQERQAGKNQ
jgi:hypothetical protein